MSEKGWCILNEDAQVALRHELQRISPELAKAWGERCATAWRNTDQSYLVLGCLSSVILIDHNGRKAMTLTLGGNMYIVDEVLVDEDVIQILIEDRTDNLLPGCITVRLWPEFQFSHEGFSGPMPVEVEVRDLGDDGKA